ncbi:MAG: ubiquinone biosynthesis regulatory protein kinase UbiB [Acidiferrobacteraceae bacterium]|nr:ubiquinone biosynthesis regulatory protein kinase UbiB [Acidiferrobacteraceae bacterium]MBT5980583.1 ubiquinone biosynthesis regulatory protein kinase UbiB [Acidiferrobacteraceae bacterium]
MLRIVRVLVRHGLDEFVFTLHLFRPYRFLLFLFPGYWFRDRNVPRGQRLREALEELGPVFVKFGQAVSTRPDLIPADIAVELTRLQDDVLPFPGDEAREIIERALDAPLSEHFASFDIQPLASASVAQVHGATLQDSTEVVVKVLRPGIEKVIEQDLQLLYQLARLADRHWPNARRLRPLEVVDDYDKTIHDELDMMREGANASQLRSNFLDSDMIYVPQIYWDHSCREVLVMERVEGIPIRDIDAIRAAGIDLRKLAHNGVEIFFTQAFRDGFFHADMHPGNIFVSPQGQYRAVDFGIMGTLAEADKRYLAENLLAFFNRDYRAVAMAHLRAGWVPATTRPEEFEAAVRTVCEPIFARPISEISFGHLVIRLFQVARRFDMPVQPQLVLLQKTLLNIEGLGRQLYPELDLWETAKPFLERWMREQVGPRALARALRRELPTVLPLLPELPGLVHELLRRQRDGQLVIRTGSDNTEQLARDLKHRTRQRDGLMLGGGLLLGAIVLFLGSEVLALGVLATAGAMVLTACGALLIGISSLGR